MVLELKQLLIYPCGLNLFTLCMFLFLFLFLPHSTGKNLYKLTSLPCFLLWKLQINSCVSPCAGVNEMWPPMRERVSLWGWRGCTGDDGVALGWSWWLWSWLYLQAWISPVINYFFFVLCPLYCYLISSYANVFIGLLVFVISCLPFFLFLFWWVGGSAVAYPSVSWMAGPAADSHLFCFCFIL